MAIIIRLWDQAQEQLPKLTFCNLSIQDHFKELTNHTKIQTRSINRFLHNNFPVLIWEVSILNFRSMPAISTFLTISVEDTILQGLAMKGKFLTVQVSLNKTSKSFLQEKVSPDRIRICHKDNLNIEVSQNKSIKTPPDMAIRISKDSNMNFTKMIDKKKLMSILQRFRMPQKHHFWNNL